MANKLFCLTRISVDTFDGSTIDEVKTEVNTKVFATENEAKAELKNLYEDDVYELIDDEESGYSEHHIDESGLHASVSIWNEDGGGVKVELDIVERVIE